MDWHSELRRKSRRDRRAYHYRPGSGPNRAVFLGVHRYRHGSDGRDHRLGPDDWKGCTPELGGRNLPRACERTTRLTLIVMPAFLRLRKLTPRRQFATIGKLTSATGFWSVTIDLSKNRLSVGTGSIGSYR